MFNAIRPTMQVRAAEVNVIQRVDLTSSPKIILAWDRLSGVYINNTTRITQYNLSVYWESEWPAWPTTARFRVLIWE